jgi:tRNA (guanine37-N1)-methyltransferase
MRIDAVTIFPEYFTPLGLSLLGKAQQSGLVDLVVHDLRDFAHDRHRSVDDTPAGGGAGMVMRPQPWGEALDHVATLGPHAVQPLLLVPSPSGEVLTQSLAHRLATEPWLVLACGRYEGIDQRVLDEASERGRVLPISIGDYVLAGGESAALVIVEAVTRLLPGVLGNAESLVEESHEGGLLEYPVYTKPSTWRGRETPEVLGSGHHARICAWRQTQRLVRTALRRPDLMRRWLAEHEATLTEADRNALDDAGWVD